MRSPRHGPRRYLLTIELLEGRQLLSGSVLPPVAFVGPVQAAVGSATPTYPSGQPDTTPDDDGAYSTAASASANNFIGPIQTAPSATATYYSATTGTAAKGYTQSPSDYSSYTYYKPTYSAKYYDAVPSVATEHPAVLDAKPPPQIAEAAIPIRPPTTLTSVATPLALAPFRPNEEATPPSANHLAPGPATADADDAAANSTNAPFSLTNHLQTTLALASNTLGQELIGSSAYGTAPIHAMPQLASLLTGAMRIDLANLQGAIDKFFARLEGLADDMAPAPETLRLTHWLLAGATTTGVFEYLRTKVQSPAPPARGNDDDDLWAPYPVLALVPPEDKP